MEAWVEEALLGVPDPPPPTVTGYVWADTGKPSGATKGEAV